MIDKVIERIDSQEHQNVQRLFEFLRIPSISTDPKAKGDMYKAAEWIKSFFDTLKLPSRIIETNGQPTVFAEAPAGDPNAPTVLIYGHFDVQPAGDEKLWNSPPFEPAIRDGAIFARGSADDKGQIFAHMCALESWITAHGKPPVNVKFLIEGEEEIGSPNISALIENEKTNLACDYVVLSDTPKFSENKPAITAGTKGMVYKEIIMKGPKQDLHSGSFGGTVANPANELAKLLGCLKDENGKVTIPGFYDDARALTDEEKAAFAELPFDENDYLNSLGSPELDGEVGFSTLERRWARPTLDVNGLISGFTGDGASTIVPAKAVAKLSMRIVPDQNPKKISELFDRAVESLAPDTVRTRVETYACAAPYLVPLDSPGMKAASHAVEAGFGDRPFYIREGGTLPILALFKSILDADSLLIGLCSPNCNAHGPNEFFHVADLQRGAKSSAHFLKLLAEINK